MQIIVSKEEIVAMVDTNEQVMGLINEQFQVTDVKELQLANSIFGEVLKKDNEVIAETSFYSVKVENGNFVLWVKPEFMIDYADVITEVIKDIIQFVKDNENEIMPVANSLKDYINNEVVPRIVNDMLPFKERFKLAVERMSEKMVTFVTTYFK